MKYEAKIDHYEQKRMKQKGEEALELAKSLNRKAVKITTESAELRKMREEVAQKRMKINGKKQRSADRSTQNNVFGNEERAAEDPYAED